MGLDMQLRTLPEGAEKAKMVQTYGQLVLKREYICGMQRRQETALDQVQIEITATPNLPVEVLTVGRYLDSILKGLLVEYVNQLPNIHNRDMHGVKMIIEFDQRLQALNLKITSPLDTTVFKNIRLPAWIRQILPLHHSTNLVEQVYRAVLGERLYGKCILERGHVHTFDKKTYNYQLDDCYHNRMRLSDKKAMCASSPSSPLQVSYSSPVTQAKVLRHAVLHRTGQVCFSKEMLPECDIGFIASETMVQEAG